MPCPLNSVYLLLSMLQSRGDTRAGFLACLKYFGRGLNCQRIVFTPTLAPMALHTEVIQRQDTVPDSRGRQYMDHEEAGVI